MLPLLISASVAATFIDYVDGWRLFRASDGGKCIIQRQTPEQTNVGIVLDTKLPDRAIIAVANAAWGSIQQGTAYDVQAQVGRTNYAETAEGGSHGIKLTVDRAPLLKSLANGDRITITRNGVKLLDLTPPPGGAASRALAACMAGSNDPFARP